MNRNKAKICKERKESTVILWIFVVQSVLLFGNHSVLLGNDRVCYFVCNVTGLFPKLTAPNRSSTVPHLALIDLKVLRKLYDFHCREHDLDTRPRVNYFHRAPCKVIAQTFVYCRVLCKYALA